LVRFIQCSKFASLCQGSNYIIVEVNTVIGIRDPNNISVVRVSQLSVLQNETVLLTGDCLSPQELDAIRNSLIICVSFFDVRMSSGKMGGHEAEACIMVL
jgi:hypothetical protein